MVVSVTHAKVNNIADWTQAELDAQIAAGNYPVGTTLADITLPSDWNDDHMIAGLAAVASTGSYNDLSDKPTIPTGTIDGTLTSNELVYSVDSNTVGSLAVATYPSLTEVSYVKGVTSAIQTQLGSKVPFTGATSNVDIGAYKYIGRAVQADGSAGLSLHNSAAQDVLLVGSGGGINATAYGGWNFDGATANTIASFGASKTLASLDTATYPSLTELSYVKGVTSAVQTQLNGKTSSAVVPSTAPSAGQLLVGNAGNTAYAPVSLSGSGATFSLSSAGVLTVSGIANASLTNSTITIAGTSTALGGSITQDTITGLSSTGLIKRTGANTLAVATAGTDYVAPSGALGTPSSGTLTNCTGLPISTGVSGLGANVATFLATPSSANLASALTDETGTAGTVPFYSTGTWTVNLYDAVTAGNVSATSVTGNYSRIGNEVTIYITGLNNIDTTGMTGANVLYFSLPFTPAQRAVGSAVLEQFTYPASRVQANSVVIASQARGRLFASASGQAVANFTVASITTGVSDIADLTLTYRV